MLDIKVKSPYNPPMNRGHVYLEMWYWLLDRIEDEQDDAKREAMNTVNLAMQGGIDNPSLAVQYDCAMKAVDVANKLNLDLIAANLDALTHDVLYSDYQPHPVEEAYRVELELGDTLNVSESKTVVMTSTRVKTTVSRDWARRHLNVEDGVETALDKAFGKGNWILA